MAEAENPSLEEAEAAATAGACPSVQDMELEPQAGDGDGDSNVGLEKPESEVGNGETSDATNESAKRGREEGADEENGVLKKQKAEHSVEENRLEELNEKKGEQEAEEAKAGPVGLGTKIFGSSVEMFDYFYKFLHIWPPNVDINKYEHVVLLDLLKKGHAEPEKKTAGGVRSFQVRYHPTWKSRCFFILRQDGVVDDFSFRKCVDNILPLPESMKVHHVNANGNKKSDGHRKESRHGGRGGRGRGRGGFRR